MTEACADCGEVEEHFDHWSKYSEHYHPYVSLHSYENACVPEMVEVLERLVNSQVFGIASIVEAAKVVIQKYRGL